MDDTTVVEQEQPVEQGLGDAPSDGVTSRGVNSNQQGDVTIKESAIKHDINPAGLGDKAVHLPPYHTKETYDIAKGRAEENKNADKPYEYEANGYTVKEIDAAENVVTENGKAYEVTSGDFLMTFTSKRAAEIYVETHAEAHKDQPATISKA